MNIYFQLIASFFRIGAFTFGGGYAMLPLLEREAVEKRQWLDKEELLDYFSVGQCLPGIIAVNTASFIGYKVGGIPGGLSAVFGVVSPSLVVIMVIARLLQHFAEMIIVQQAFAGIRVAVVVLIVNTLILLIKANIQNKIGWMIFFGAFVLVAMIDASPVAAILTGAAIGLSGLVRRGGMGK